MNFKSILSLLVFIFKCYGSQTECIKLLLEISKYENIIRNMKYHHDNDASMKQWREYRTKIQNKKSLFEQFNCRKYFNSKKYSKLKKKYRTIYVDITDKED